MVFVKVSWASIGGWVTVGVVGGVGATGGVGVAGVGLTLPPPPPQALTTFEYLYPGVHKLAPTACLYGSPQAAPDAPESLAWPTKQLARHSLAQCRRNKLRRCLRLHAPATRLPRFAVGCDN